MYEEKIIIELQYSGLVIRDHFHDAFIFTIRITDYLLESLQNGRSK